MCVEQFVGEHPKDLNSRKTALVVFASQRQASKCAYVRTRIAFEGAFATHFHHYSKVKKEIAVQGTGNAHPKHSRGGKHGGLKRRATSMVRQQTCPLPTHVSSRQ